MTTFNLDGAGTTSAMTRRGQTDTYNLTHGHTLKLTNNGGNATITEGAGLLSGGDSDNFVLTEHGGTTAINLLGQCGAINGTMFLYDGAKVNETGWTHSWWNNTGASLINASSATVTRVGGGSIMINHGGSLTAGYADSAVTLDGGTLNVSGFFGSPSATATFGSQTKQNPDRITLLGATGATSYDIHGDMLTMHNDAGMAVGFATVHNQTGAPLQVDQGLAGIAIIANATPQPGMIVGHVV